MSNILKKATIKIGSVWKKPDGTLIYKRKDGTMSKLHILYMDTSESWYLGEINKEEQNLQKLHDKIARLENREAMWNKVIEDRDVTITEYRSHDAVFDAHNYCPHQQMHVERHCKGHTDRICYNIKDCIHRKEADREAKNQ